MMSMVRTIDRYLYSLFQKLPQLSPGIKVALAKDLWIAASLFLVLYLIQLVGYGSLVASLVYANNSEVQSILSVPVGVIGAPAEEVGLVVLIIYTLLLVLICGLIIRSIKPLRQGFREGWIYFLAVLLLVIVGVVFSISVGLLASQQIVTSLVVAVLFIYVMYQCRQEFKI